MRDSRRTEAMRSTGSTRLCVGCHLAALLIAVVPAAAQDGEVSFNAGLAHLRDGRTELAIEAFKDAVEEDGENPYFYKGLGLAYMRANQLKDAIKAFEKALDLNPYYVDVRNDLGTALILSGKREDGKAEFLKAFNDPQNPTPEISAHNLGQAYFEEQNYQQALSWFQTSAQRNERYPGSHIGIANALFAMGQTDEGIAQLELGLDQLPKEVELMLALGEAYYEVGRFGEARQKLEAVAASDPAGAFGRRALELLRKFPQ
jgi:Flp pilus assembly protein TadD